MTEARCPRCTGPLGENTAGSRVTTDRSLRICILCGTDEAERDLRGKAPVPPGDWPLAL